MSRGGWVPPIVIADRDQRELASITGRDLTPSDFATLVDALDAIARLREMNAKGADEAVTPADVRRTLAAIAKASDGDAARMAADCDTVSIGAIDAQRFRTRDAAATLQEAAHRALAALPKASAGRSTDGALRLLIRAALQQWAHLGGDPAAPIWVKGEWVRVKGAPNAWRERASAIVRFTSCIATIAGWPRPDNSYLARRIRETRSNFSPTLPE